jgi:hypothetical protein
MTFNEDANFSKIENIEIKRRSDEVDAIINAAIRQFINRTSWRSSMKSAQLWRLRIDGGWFLLLFIAGIGLDWYLRKSSNGFDFNFGTFIWVGILAAYYFNQYELYKINQEIDSINERLYVLEMKWLAATGAGTFWELEGFIEDGYFDDSDEKFKEWKAWQRDYIISSVCD